LEIITSRQNRLALSLAALNDKKNRDSEGLFLLDGRKLFLEAVASGLTFKQVVCTERYYVNHKSEVEKYSPIIFADSVFDKISRENSPDGIICVLDYLDNLHKKTTIYNNDKNQHSLFMAISIQDPGNLGTIIRTASAFGIDEIIVDDCCADIYNRKTLRASMGAILRTRISVCSDIKGTVDALRASGRRVFAAALDRTSVELDRLDVKTSDVFMVGNEGHGLPSDIIELCDRSVFIPMMPNSESLNAAHAATVLLWEKWKKGRV
jgi:TrmH family RNA methyltransferase